MLRFLFPSRLAWRITLRLLAVAGRIVTCVCGSLWRAGRYERNELARAALGQTQRGGL